MIAAFVVMTLVATFCAAVVGLALEPIFAQLGRPRRWAWVFALGLSLALLASAPWRRAPVARPIDSGAVASGQSIAVIATLSSAADRLPHSTPSVLLVAWAAASGVLLLLMVLVDLRYARLSRRWPAASIDGATVRVSPNYGPAVVGFVRPQIVVPRWLLDRSAGEQAIAVTHEREHIRARDPLLLGAAWIAAALIPWSPAVWWMSHRLRLAIELDCDARVLGGGAPATDYGNLLIDVAAFRSGIRLPAGALLHPRNNLHRRLQAMHATRVRFGGARAAAAVVIALAAFIVACEAKLPTSSEIQHMSVAGAERSARANGFVGDTIEYLVNGLPFTQAEAESIPDSLVTSVAFVPNQRGGGQLRVNTLGASYHIRTATAEDTILARPAPDGEMRGRVGRSGRRGGGAGDMAEGRGLAVGPTSLNLGDKFNGLLFVDGKQVSPSTLRNYPVSRIASIEIIKGVAAARDYSDPAAVNGVIKVTTRR